MRAPTPGGGEAPGQGEKAVGRTILQLAETRTVIFDGAMGTMLMATGLQAGQVPERLNIDHPERIMDIHRLYYEAGADAVHTNTFGGNPVKLAERGAAGQVELLNREGARIASLVRPPGKFVAGDMGPTGKMMAPLGDVTRDRMEEAFRVQAAALLEGGADFISIETMFSLDEALAAVAGARKAGAGIVVAATTYQMTKRGFFTVMGESPARCAAAFRDAGADVIAANCTLGSAEMIDLTRELRAASDAPILIQPNAGKPVTRKGETRYLQEPEEFGRDCLEIAGAGASMVGGCCGTDERFIRETVRAVLG
jgi:5-methyltetrahydrofolate--homocysteine methyltransferase